LMRYLITWESVTSCLCNRCSWIGSQWPFVLAYHIIGHMYPECKVTRLLFSAPIEPS
jgi:hypothetical protein